jgi:hypothetical protein
MLSVWSLPLRFLGFPLAFAFGCLALLSNDAIAEYAGAEEVSRTWRRSRRLFPLREWLLTALRTTFPEFQ